MKRILITGAIKEANLPLQHYGFVPHRRDPGNKRGCGIIPVRMIFLAGEDTWNDCPVREALKAKSAGSRQRKILFMIQK